MTVRSVRFQPEKRELPVSWSFINAKITSIMRTSTSDKTGYLFLDRFLNNQWYDLDQGDGYKG